jgi:hypothetical protein
MIAIVWQFEVRVGKSSEFEELFGADGDWNAMNRHSRSYLGTSFLRDQTSAQRYLLIEYWSEMLVAEHHKQYRRDAVEQLEARRDALIVSVEPMGVFTALDVPDRTGPTWSRRTE